MKDSTMFLIIALSVVFLFSFIALISTTAKYSFECTSGIIDGDLLINGTNNTHLQLTHIDGLSCKGSGEVPLIVPIIVGIAGGK